MSEQPGKMVRGYELRNAVGAGGFGEVFHAFQSVVGREVAVKVIRQKYVNDPQFIRRFEAEARMIARLEHPHIVPLYDYWRDPEGAYLVMRWLGGGSLRAQMKDHRFQVPEIVRVLNQLASALSLAHSRDIIHRDIKPENILMDEQGNVYLTDFGIAVDLVRDQEHLAEALAYGSPEYVAPEQLTEKTVSSRSDVYSLGIMLYEMLANVRPFSGSTTREIVKMQVRNPVPSLKLSRPDLPSDMDTIIWQATAKRPEVRYENVMMLALAFQQVASTIDNVPQAYQIPTRRARRTIDEDAITTGKMEDGAFGTASISTGKLHTVDLGTQDLSTGTIDLSTGTIDLSTADLDSLAPGLMAMLGDRPENPYKGLRPFEEEDADHFFGRENLVLRLLEHFRTDNKRFLALIGPSGSGKSSVVRAGVIPALRRGALPGSESWFVTSMVPGADPFQALSEALLSVAVKAPDDWGVQLRNRIEGVYQLLSAILPEEDAELVLFIDQFEEVFTMSEDEAVRQRFLEALYYALIVPESRLRLIITLRADFYDRPLYYPEFGELVQQHTEVVLPLSKDELKDAINLPASNVGIIVESEMTTAIIDDVYNQPGALPLLQYTLTEMYERTEDPRLTLEDYRDIGGISGALAQRADELYVELTDEAKGIAQQIFLRLIALGEGSKVTRRRVVWPNLVSGIRNMDVLNEVIDRYSKHRLLTLDRDPTTRSPTVEVAHEALIAEWEELQQWIEQNRSDLLRAQQLRLAVDEWLRNSRDSSYLASGRRLGEFEGLLYSQTLLLGKDDRDYIEASIARREAEARRAQYIIAALSIFSIVTLILAVLAVINQRRAAEAREEAIAAEQTAVANEEIAVVARETAFANEQLAISAQGTAVANEQVARSRELAASSRENLARNDLALLLSVEAVRAADTYEAVNGLLVGLQANPFLAGYLHGHDAPVRSVAYSSDGRLIASGDESGTIRLWDAETRTMLGEPLVGHQARVNRVVFSLDNAQIISAANDGTVRVWSVETGEELTRFETHEAAIWGLSISPDGERVVSSDESGRIVVHELASGAVVLDMTDAHEGDIFDVVYSPDGMMIASGGGDNQVRLWWSTSGELLTELSGHTDWVFALAFSPDGNELASSGSDRTIRFWDLANLEARATLVTEHLQLVRALSYNTSGQFIASASDDRSVRIWSPITGQLITTLNAHAAPVRGVAFQPDPDAAQLRLVSGGNDGIVALWQLALPHRPGSLATTIGRVLEDFEVNADRTIFAAFSSGDDGAITAWNAADGSILLNVAQDRAEARDIALSSDGMVLAVGKTDGSIVVYDVGQGEALVELSDHEAGIARLTFTRDDQFLIAVAEDGLVLRWDTADYAVAQTPIHGAESGGVTSMAMTDDGRFLALGGRDGQVWVWNWETEEQVAVLTGHRDPVDALIFDHTGTILVTGSRDNTIIQWDFLAGEALGDPMTGHEGIIFDLAISPDNRLLASGDDVNLVRLWDMDSARSIGQPLIGHRDRVTGLLFTDDDTLLSTGHDGTILRWNLAVEAWVATACSISNRNLTLEEWEQFLREQPYQETC